MEKISNFHTHTRLCHHALDLPVDYAVQAEKEGCSALGFSDHCPFPESVSDYWPEIRMTIKESEFYRNEIEKAKKKVSFPIYTGYECEWEKSCSSWYDELKSSYGAEYLVLGSHWVTSGTSHIYVREIDTPKLLNKYIDQTIDGMRSGKFAYLAHPDLFMLTGREWNEQTIACSQALINAAVDLGLPIEINGTGISRAPNSTNKGMRYQYPYLEFWELAAQTKVKVICNSDAHNPEDVIFNAWKTRDFAKRLNFTPIETIF